MIELSRLESIELEDVDTKDYPDFSDACISYAEIDGRALDDRELDEVNENSSFVHECVMKKLY